MLVVTPHNTAEELQKLAKRERDANVAARLRVVALAMQELSCVQIGAVLGRAPDYALRWVRRYNEDGIEGLRTQERPGRPRVLTPPQMDKVRAFIAARAAQPGRAGRVTGRQLHEFVERELGVSMSLSASFVLLHRLGIGGAKGATRRAQVAPPKKKAAKATKAGASPAGRKPRKVAAPAPKAKKGAAAKKSR